MNLREQMLSPHHLILESEEDGGRAEEQQCQPARSSPMAKRQKDTGAGMGAQCSCKASVRN